MHAITLEEGLENQLLTLAKAMGKPVGECLKEAVQQYLENRLDYLVGVNALARKETSISLDELEDELDAKLIRERVAEWERQGRPGISLEEYARSRGIGMAG